MDVSFGGTLAGVDVAPLSVTITPEAVPARLRLEQDGVTIVNPQQDAESIVVDFAAQNLTVAADTFTLDMDGQLGELTEASGNIQIAVDDFLVISGDVLVRQSTVANGTSLDSKLTIGGSNIAVFVGTGAGTADAVGVSITDTDFGIAVFKSSDATLPTQPDTTYALTAQGTATLLGVDGVTLTGTMSALINRTGKALDEQIPTRTGSIPLQFTDGAEFTQVSGSDLHLNIGGLADLTGSFTVSKQTLGNATTTILTGSDITAFVGDSRGTTDTADDLGVKISNAALDLRLFNGATPADSSYALAAQGTPTVVGVPGLSFPGELFIHKNTGASDITLDFGNAGATDDVLVASGVSRVGANNVTLSVANFIDVTGNLSVSTQTTGDVTTTNLVINTSAFVGDTRGTPDLADDIGVRISDVRVDLQLLSGATAADASYALAGNGTAEIVGVPGLTLSGTIAIEKNTGASDVTLGLGTPDPSDDVLLNAGANRVGGSLTLGTPLVDLTGNFFVETTGTSPNREILIGATDVATFLGDENGTADPGDDVGVQLSEMDLIVLVKPDNTYALDASGAAALLGVPDLTLNGTLSVQKNTTGEAVNRTISIGEINKTLDLPADVSRVAGTVTLGVDGFTELSGGFVFAKEVSTTGSVTTTEITAAAAGIDVFMGSGSGTDQKGVQIENANLGFLLRNSTGGGPATKGYAFTAGGSATLLGVDGLSLSGTLAAQVNATGVAVDKTILVPDPDGGADIPVELKFATGDAVQRLAGDVSLAVDGFVNLSGGFVFQKNADGSQIVVGATNVTAFVGTGSDTPDTTDDQGIAVANGNLGVVLFTPQNSASTYALTASGDVALVGLDGLEISGTASVQVNRSGQSIDEVVQTTSGEVPIVFATGDDVTTFQSDATLSIDGVFTLAGELSATKLPSGSVLIDVPDMDLSCFGTGSKCLVSVAHRDSQPVELTASA
ncbi:MAG: hypothetical protein O2856_08305 [Planctomycetota bacterium]|nr:hypothetical protein [Planctomycetota bacterium]